MKDQTCYVVCAGDSVATALGQVQAGPVSLLGEADAPEITALEAVPFGHKLSVRRILQGEPVVKYGTKIGTATREIPPGVHVHLHNLRSDFDERAASLDEVTAEATDISYEITE